MVGRGRVRAEACPAHPTTARSRFRPLELVFAPVPWARLHSSARYRRGRDARRGSPPAINRGRASAQHRQPRTRTRDREALAGSAAHVARRLEQPADESRPLASHFHPSLIFVSLPPTPAARARATRATPPPRAAFRTSCWRQVVYKDVYLYFDFVAVFPFWIDQVPPRASRSSSRLSSRQSSRRRGAPPRRRRAFRFPRGVLSCRVLSCRVV